MAISKYVPNAFTMANLASGSIAVILAMNGQLVTAAFFVFLGIFFDFFDGFFARVLNAQSEVGLQLDSLADMVTSGLAPGIVMVQLLRQSLGWTRTERLDLAEMWDTGTWLPLLGLSIALASAYRLAKFNVDTRQTSSFIGLPTPANALLILSLPLILRYQADAAIAGFILNPWTLGILTAISCYLLNAELPLFALKFKTWSFAENKVRYIFLAVAAVLLVLLKFIAIPVIIGLYVVVSLWSERNKVIY